MIYIVLRGTTYRGEAELHEFKTEKEAIAFLGGKPTSRLVGVFNGKRLDVKMGTKRITKRGAVGFEKHKKKPKE